MKKDAKKKTCVVIIITKTNNDTQEVISNDYYRTDLPFEKATRLKFKNLAPHLQKLDENDPLLKHIKNSSRLGDLK